MKRNTGGLGDRTFEVYDPAVEWSHAADADVATISLPGFKKDELQVQLDNHGRLWVRGERPVEAGSSKWIRFKELKVPDNCDVGDCRAKFPNNKLTITIPKKKSRPSPPESSAPKPAPTTVQQEEKAQAPKTQEEKSTPSPTGGSAPKPAQSTPEEKSHSSLPSGGSTPEPAPELQEKDRPSPPDGSAPQPAPEEKIHPSSPEVSTPVPAPLVVQEKSRPSSPLDSSAPEPVPTMQSEDEDDEEMMVEIEMAGGRKPINWLLVTVAAVLIVGITAYVACRKLRSGCATGAGDHGPGELAGGGSFINEM